MARAVSWFAFSLLATVAIADAAAAEESSNRPDSRPNLIFIVFDTLRAESLGCYGYDRPTSPTIDAIAKDGTLFENHFAQALFTFPSVSSYFTGKYFPVDCLADPHVGVEELEVPPREKMLTEILKTAGYQSAIVTPHIGYFSPECRLSKSFDSYLPVLPPPSSKPGKALFHDAMKPALDWMDSNRDKPFFLYLHLIDTHFPHRLEAPYTKWLKPGFSSAQIRDGQPTEISEMKFSSAEKEHLRGMYDGSILEADKQLEAFMAALDERGISDNTILAIGSDHGETLGEDGTTWGHFSVDFDQILRVPFILRGPGIPKGRRVTQMTENVDIVPTLAALLSIQPDADFDGHSLIGAMKSDAEGPQRRFVFAKNPMQHKGRVFPQPPIYIVRTETKKYIYDALTKDEHIYNVPDNCGERKELAQSEQTLREMVSTRFQPHWESYAQLPTVELEFPMNSKTLSFLNTPGDVIPFDEKRSGELHSDNKWQSHNGMIWSCAWQEDAPPITLNLPVRSGEYAVYVHVYSKSDHFGHPATSISFGQEGGKTSVITDDSAGLDQNRMWTSIRVGQFTVTDNVFSAIIDDVQDGRWCYLQKIRFVPITGASPDATQNAERVEALRALGYIE